VIAAPPARHLRAPATTPRAVISTRTDVLGRLPLLAVGTAAAVAVIAVAYTMSREQIPWSGTLFWCGEALLYAMPCILLVSRNLTRTEGLGLAVLVPLSTYLVLECYSPIQFRFLDELAHVQNAQWILTTHHLFHVNTDLPVSSYYPALEIITTTVSFLSRLSVYASGTIVVGVAHVALGLGIYLLAVEITGRPRLGGLAVVIYACGPHFQFFDSYFTYEVVAFPFFVASLLAAAKALHASGAPARRGWCAVALAAAAVTVVSHHVTSYVLALFLIAFVLCARFVRPRRDGVRELTVVTIATIAFVVVWDLRIAPNTLAYFAPETSSLVASLRHIGSSGSSFAKIAQPLSGPKGSDLSAGASTSSLRDTLLEFAGQLVLVILTLRGGWAIWRSKVRMRKPLVVACGLTSLSLFAAFAIRVADPSNGAELSARAYSYDLIPVGITAAYGLVSLMRPRRRRTVAPRLFVSRVGAVGAVAALVLVGLGGIAAGWPAYYSRLPGPYLAEAWERSIDDHNLQLAQWTAQNIPVDSGVASDFSTGSELASLGHLADTEGVAGIFLSPTIGPRQIALIRSLRVDFVAVDDRIDRLLPATGYYFNQNPNPNLGGHPMPVADLDKFATDASVSRVFDDGTLQLYDVTALEHG
jgi:hypothetical protein